VPHWISPPSLARALRIAPTLLAAWVAAASAAADPLPTVASINVCADQHVLALADPEESLFAREAKRFALNYGTAEELL
jgi:hypothetical protein